MRVSKHPQERRAEILAAARQLFDERGVEKTRVSDIVQRVGVAQGVFYYYFASKDEIVDEIVRLVSDEIRARVDGILAKEQGGFCKKLAGFIEIYISVIDQFLADDQTNLQSLAAAALQKQDIVRKGEALLQEALLALVQSGVKSGEITIAYPAQTTLVLLYGLRALAAACLPTRRELYSIVEHGLGLPKGSLVAYIQN